MYGFRRKLLFEGGMVSDDIFPGRSIAAGGGFAVYEVAAFVESTITSLASSFPRLLVSLHVDDLQLHARAGREDEAANMLIEGTKWAR